MSPASSRSLNDRQRQAVHHAGRPLLVAAGAGTGKTRVIVHRLAFLIESGAPAQRLLAVTFTNRAAEEIRNRVSALTATRGEHVSVGTFHWLGHRLLRRYGASTAVGAEFRLLTPRQSMAVLRSILHPGEVGPARNVAEVRGAVTELRHGLAPSSSPGEIDVEDIAARYVRAMRGQGALDLDDLILESSALLRNHARVRSSLQTYFRHILVDEYQDTNRSQNDLLTLLAGDGSRLTVVGDDDQAIYGWRFASADAMVAFPSLFPTTQIIRLEVNYRSTQRILTPANELLRHNQTRIGKRLRATRGAGRKPEVFAAGDESEEAGFVVRAIAQLNEREMELPEIAVLFRMNVQSRPIEDALVKAGIPYQVRAGLRFYERPEVAAIVDGLRIVATGDEIAMAAVLRRLPGVGPVRSLRLAGRMAADPSAARTDIATPTPMGVPPAALRLMAGLRAEVAGESLTGAVERVVGLLRRELEPTADGRADREAADANVSEFMALAAQFAAGQGAVNSPGVVDFLDRLALSTVPSGRGETGPKPGGVQLMTIHGAKGLEFEAVFIVGVEAGLLPHRRARSQAEIEEERRLLYVGMTRARRHLYLSYARTRLIPGPSIGSGPSPFLREMPAHLFSMSQSPASTRDRLIHVSVGERIEHARWGQGVVVATEGSGAKTMVALRFATGETRSVQLRHAPLKRIS